MAITGWGNFRPLSALSVDGPLSAPPGKRGEVFLYGIENLPAFDLTKHATKSARAIRNLDHAVGDHRDRCPCPDHHCRRLVHDSMSQLDVMA